LLIRGSSFSSRYSFGELGFGCVGDPGGAFGPALEGVGFEEGGGTSGDEFGTDGEVGGAGTCSVQATVKALNAMAARVDLVRLMLTLLLWTLNA
jgi:hypothetical protein